VAPIVNGAVEGDLDRAVLSRLIEEAGGTIGRIYVRNGRDKLLQSLPGYAEASRFARWVVLIDLDDHPCPVAFRSDIIPDCPPTLCFRIAVRSIEAWLLGDIQRMSTFLGIQRARLPSHPESLNQPKKSLVQFAAGSRRRDIREDIAPPSKGVRTVGPGYNGRLIEFVNDRENGWRPTVAAAVTPSLARAIRCIATLVSDADTD
jgi:hypothetical protein